MNKIGRITSIDALRGFVLLGILLVHTCGLFGYANGVNSFEYFTEFDNNLRSIIHVVLSGRCNNIFSILFGVSFYLILKNPQYSSLKFCWRCILLITLGILVKFFYTYDALMWYGLMGIMLICFRYMKTSTIFVSYIACFLLSILLRKFQIGNFLFGELGNDKYLSINSLEEIVSYPIIDSIIDYLRIVLNGGIFGTLSYFIIGYYIARKGIIENIKEHIKIKYLLYVGFLYLLFFSVTHSIDSYTTLFRVFSNLFGGIFYLLCFLCFYYNSNLSFTFLESYGKLGLTNYCIQNMGGVVLMSTIFIPYKFHFFTILSIMILFYMAQMLFSVLWLRYFKYGPFEWCWRCLTNLKIMDNYKG